MIGGTLPDLEILRRDSDKPGYVRVALVNVATELGVVYEWNKLFSGYAGTDFHSCLKSLEALYRTFSGNSSYSEYAAKVRSSIEYAISLCETDIDVEWRDGVFWPSGAKLLDVALVNENLKWLADKGYHGVLGPFEKGLRHFLEAQQHSERLADTVTDIYEAVEALAKVVTGRDNDLSGNAELFISKLELSDYYRKMLKDYIDYANDYRHAAKLGEKKKPLIRNEVEAFIYTSGLFIRLVVQQITEKSS
ncbi:MAG: hypothetical protein HY665_02040 [Chloroflexi bacterium]|nr:hypothetical protein [Chloroflexota bacterium]